MTLLRVEVFGGAQILEIMP